MNNIFKVINIKWMEEQQRTKGNQLIEWDQLHADDIVIVPAFGTTIEIQEKLSRLGIDPYSYDTTCPFVEKVWNRSEQIAQKGYSIIVHGKPTHEETRATFSHSDKHTPTLVINDLKEAEILLCNISSSLQPIIGSFQL